jgi:hypothetical protein
MTWVESMEATRSSSDAPAPSRHEFTVDGESQAEGKGDLKGRRDGEMG